MSQSTEAAAEIEVEEDFEEAVIEEPTGPVIALEDPVQQKRLIEALLFASPEPISLRMIQNRLPDSADVGAILLELQADYAERGVNLVRMEDVWAFRTPADMGAHLALTKREEKKLSRAALETLAIISYHQPITRAEVENIRGVATSKGTLDVLMEAGWIKPGRRLETPGRPLTWITTNVFLDEFGLSDLKDLPGISELKATGLLDTRPAIDTIPGAADLFGANENKQSVSEDEESDEDDDDNYEEAAEDKLEPAAESDDEDDEDDVETDEDESDEDESDEDDDSDDENDESDDEEDDK
jgi:segregation and condensation protein B